MDTPSTVFNQPIRPTFHTDQVNGKTIIVVHVPEAAPHEKPIYLKSTGLPRGALRRIGSTDQRCTEDDLLVFYDGQSRESFDSGIVMGADLSDIATEAIDDYRKARSETNPDAEELGWSNEDLLQSLGCLKRDSNGSWRPTIAGLILFGKPIALRRCFPMTRVDYIRVPGREWVPDPDKRFETVELRDYLFRLIRRAQATVLDDLPSGFELKENSLQRVDKPVIPLRVLREALVNALMHRSYRVHSAVQIIRYANRLEIRNPGFSLKAAEHLGEPGSNPRNPSIAAVLHETRFAETKGSGIRVMRTMLEEAGLVPPFFESDRGGDLFTVRLHFHHFLSSADLQWIARLKDHKLSEDEIRAIVYVRESGIIDNATYREITKVDTLQASTALRRLRQAGLLRQVGKGSATKYEPTEFLLDGSGYETPPPQAPSHALATVPSAALSTNPQPLSTNRQGVSTNPQPSSTNLQGLATVLDSSPRRQELLNELPGELAARVGALGKRQAPAQVAELIAELCRIRSWRAEELAILVDRNVSYLRHHYLRPLMRDGRIEMTRPETPNAPEQAYRATSNSGDQTRSLS